MPRQKAGTALIPGNSRQKFTEKQACQAGRIMADLAVLFEQISQQETHTGFLQAGEVHCHLGRALSAVAARNRSGYGLLVCHDIINDSRLDMSLNRVQMPCYGVVRRFAW